MLLIAAIGALALAAIGIPLTDGEPPSPSTSLPASPADQPTPASSLVPASASPQSTGSSPTPLMPTELPTPTPTPTPIPCPSDYLIVTCERLLSRPTSGLAWETMEAVADEDFGDPDLTDRDNKHGVRALAAALVYARTGDPTYEAKAHEALMAAVGTEREGASSVILALSRQLGTYVMIADLIRLSGPDDERFRAWLDTIRTRDFGGHGRWTALTPTHEDSINNWGSFAGASRIAASLYLGDSADVERAARVLRGFLGDRSAWSAWQEPDRSDLEWACEVGDFTPVNPPCTRDGIDLDGAIPADISRSGGGLRWPPGRTGLRYTTESLQGLSVQAELLSLAGYDSWAWQDRALMRAAEFLQRADGWNASPVSYHVPWLFNFRYDLGLPTEPAGFGRMFGYTDWLYGD